MKKFSIAIIIGLIIGTIIGFGGVSVLASPKNIDIVNTKTSSISLPKGLIPLIEAKSIALNKVPGSTIISTDFNDNTVPTYKIIVVNTSTQYNISINARTGDIINFSKNHIKTPLVFSSNINGIISESKAKEIASKEVPKSMLIGFTLDYKNLAIPQYDIIQKTTKNKYYICINAKTGDIISSTKIAL